MVVIEICESQEGQYHVDYAASVAAAAPRPPCPNVVGSLSECPGVIKQDNYSKTGWIEKIVQKWSNPDLNLSGHADQVRSTLSGKPKSYTKYNVILCHSSYVYTFCNQVESGDVHDDDDVSAYDTDASDIDDSELKVAFRSS